MTVVDIVKFAEAVTAAKRAEHLALDEYGDDVSEEGGQTKCRATGQMPDVLPSGSQHTAAASSSDPFAAVHEAIDHNDPTANIIQAANNSEPVSQTTIRATPTSAAVDAISGKQPAPPETNLSPSTAALLSATADAAAEIAQKIGEQKLENSSTKTKSKRSRQTKPPSPTSAENAPKRKRGRPKKKRNED